MERPLIITLLMEHGWVTGKKLNTGRMVSRLIGSVKEINRNEGDGAPPYTP
jgi:hypothetical protein